MDIKKMSKDELEQLSYTDIANILLIDNRKPMSTLELLKEIGKLLNFDDSEIENKLTDFFASLTIAKDFILLDDGTWDLRRNHTNKIKIDQDDDIEEYFDDMEEKSEDIDMEEDKDIEENMDIDSDDIDDDEDNDLEDLNVIDQDELEE